MKKLLVLGMLVLGVSLQASWFGDMHKDRLGLYSQCNFQEDGNRYVLKTTSLDMTRANTEIEDFGVIVVGWDRISEEDREIYEEILKRASWIATSIRDRKSGVHEPRHGVMFNSSYLPEDVKNFLGKGMSKFVFIAGYKF